MEKERTFEKELGTMKEKDKEHLSRADPGVSGTFDPDSRPPGDACFVWKGQVSTTSVPQLLFMGLKGSLG